MGRGASALLATTTSRCGSSRARARVTSWAWASSCACGRRAMLTSGNMAAEQGGRVPSMSWFGKDLRRAAGCCGFATCDRPIALGSWLATGCDVDGSQHADGRGARSPPASMGASCSQRLIRPALIHSPAPPPPRRGLDGAAAVPRRGSRAHTASHRRRKCHCSAWLRMPLLDSPQPGGTGTPFAWDTIGEVAVWILSLWMARP